MNQKQDMIDTEETMLPEPDAALLPYMEKLYPLTFALKQHKPWKTIYEYETFAVRLPDGTPACCLLTGMEGDFISLSVYSGETGWNNIHKFWETPDEPDKTQENYQELMMSQSCLQVVFCCKDDLQLPRWKVSAAMPRKTASPSVERTPTSVSAAPSPIMPPGSWK